MGNTNATPTALTLPAELKHTMHKHGGRIVRVEKIAHELAPPEEGRSRDVWHFVGDVEWRDGTKSKGLEIAPWALCYDDDRTEVDALLELLSAYLLEHGKWCHGPKSGHEGWYAHRPKAKAKR